jgi:HSP90 family molecular chaperone
VQRLKGEADGEQFDQLAHLLFDQSVLTEGGQLEDPSGFVKRVNSYPEINFQCLTSYWLGARRDRV